MPQLATRTTNVRTPVWNRGRFVGCVLELEILGSSCMSVLSRLTCEISSVPFFLPLYSRPSVIIRIIPSPLKLLPSTLLGTRALRTTPNQLAVVN
jgi:hypothetical protein